MTDPRAEHPDFTANLPIWQKCRDAAAGQTAVKAGLGLYLPPLAGQTATSTDYLSYLARANYANFTGRTLDMMVGMLLRKPMTFNDEFPASVTPWLDDITLADETLTDFAQQLISEVILTNRVGVLVEQPQATGSAQTLADKIASSTRPYLVAYKSESIINWQYARVNNRYRLVNVWLLESYQDAQGQTEEQVRQLTLDGGFYRQLVWRKADSANWSITDTIVPTKNGVAIAEIPFFPVTAGKPTLEISPSMIESLADLNLSHYQNSADLENGAHIAGIPTPYIAGVDDTNADGSKNVFYLGSSTMLLLPQDAEPGFLQCGSEGFATIEKLMDRKEQQMAALGARMLSPEKKQAEAAETHEIKRGGENAVLSNVAGSVERALTIALSFMADWEGITGDITIEINRDYVPVVFTGQDALNWTKVWQSGGISKEYLFEIFKFSEWLPDDATFEQMQDQIDAEGPTLAALAANPDPAPANDNA